MTVTAVQSKKAYLTLCSVLERNDILHECDEENLCVRCSVGGREAEMRLIFIIEPPKMLVSLYAPMNIAASCDNAADMAFALCIINDSLSDGHFCFDRQNMSVYFKMTYSFYNSFITDSVFEYMLAVAAEQTDEYYSRINALKASWKS